MSEFWNAARQALPRGQQIGLSQIAELQRRKEAADLLQRQAEQQAFENMFKQKQYDYGVGRDEVADQRYAQEYQDNKFLQQTGDAQKLGFDMLGMQNQFADNVRQDRLVNAQVQNLAEPNNRFAAGADPNAVGGGGASSNRNFLLELASKQAQAASIDEFGNFDPSKYPQNLSNIMTALERQQNPQQLMGDIYGGQPTMGQPQQQLQQQPMQQPQQQIDPNAQRAQQLESKPMQSWTDEELDWYENYINANRQ